MSISIILDCGATNVRAIAIDHAGTIVASHYMKNETATPTNNSTYHIWSFEAIWEKLVTCCQHVTSSVNKADITSLAVTTFGVDGAPFDSNGKQIYPIISWKCPRTNEVMEQTLAELGADAVFTHNGVGKYNFNTVFKLKWLKENEPAVYAKMDKWVFISSMLTHKLTGMMTTDRTMAGTSMMTTLNERNWSQPVLDYLGLTEQQFPPFVDAGEKVGEVQAELADLLGLPRHLSVISAGHDTQFALVGSGATENQPVLSSGTWEILMARVNQPEIQPQWFDDGFTTELDANNKLYNPGIQWLSSAVMEWVANTVYTDLATSPVKYETMISEAELVPAGCDGLVCDPDFAKSGALQGLTINTSRGHIYRAALEGLVGKLKQSLLHLEKASQFKAETLIVVGGGSKNRLWNQLRADGLDLPIQVVEQSETTVLGAAMYAFMGVGVYDSIEQAQHEMKPGFTTVYPQTHPQHSYQDQQQEHKELVTC
ncbi:L-fuculokinase [Photobacterium nomapromontoriensis]|uniref:L-fuculokinase n=1 Tax=Photobacterium nomapromontoriensis TaxID=2910237 RepID=UPI003D150B2B